MPDTIPPIAVERTLPLLGHLAKGVDEQMAILRYLDLMAQIALGPIELVRRELTNGIETLLVREGGTGAVWSVARPAVLPHAIETLAVAEYRRLISGEELGAMDRTLFAHLFGAAYCSNCWRRGDRQICVDCRHTGEPVNFLPFEPEAAPPLSSLDIERTA